MELAIKFATATVELTLYTHSVQCTIILKYCCTPQVLLTPQVLSMCIITVVLHIFFGFKGLHEGFFTMKICMCA